MDKEKIRSPDVIRFSTYVDPNEQLKPKLIEEKKEILFSPK